MISDSDIYRSAKQLIDRYGDDASFHACVQADEFLAIGDAAAYEVWKRIINAIKTIDGSKPTGTAH